MDVSHSTVSSGKTVVGLLTKYDVYKYTLSIVKMRLLLFILAAILMLITEASRGSPRHVVPPGRRLANKLHVVPPGRRRRLLGRNQNGGS